MFFAMLTMELHLLTRPAPSWLKWAVVAKPLPFEIINFMHSLWLMINIVIAQLGPKPVTAQQIDKSTLRQLKPHIEESQKLTLRSLEEVTNSLEVNVKSLKQSNHSKEKVRHIVRESFIEDTLKLRSKQL